MSHPQDTAPVPPAPAGQSAVYASFTLGDEEFAIDVRHVQEAVNLPGRIVSMPLAPDFVVGVFNLRGTIVPMLDMRRLLGLGTADDPAGAKVVIVQHRGVRLGLMFDDTRRVMRPRGDEQALFGYQDHSTHRVVAGVLKVGGELVRVLDLDRLVAIENVPRAGTATGEGVASRAKRNRTRCITFRVGDLLLGFAIHGVHEIVQARGIERSPVQDALCAGVMHIRDNVVPVVRFGDLLQTGAGTDGDDSGGQRVVVLQAGAMHVGLLVDSVEAIVAYSEDDVMHVPVLTRHRASMFAGCLDLGERGHVFLLDSQGVLDHGEIGRISGQHSSLFASRGRTARAAERHAGVRQSFLWFDSRQAFGLPMQDVREIIDCGDGLIPVPGAPGFVSGMYNLRGKLVTVVDVRRYYQLGEPGPQDVLEPKVVVLQQGDTLLGLQVDRVRSIVHIDAAGKYPIPSLMRNALTPRTRHHVSEVLETQGEGGTPTHVLTLDAVRIFASIGELEAEMADA
ncbi:chemotaxis protein CheW [Paracidovorax cattleyae]|uniref:chemotaxis protein CheW n=1 Tax=Paracidovorax cattleyae TaxID=80868 RepID=UPI0018AF7F36|nr:chemotaxis protein CheW [Paracidovorax cattleyae]MBF9265114.1 chemotaxis protein CheW [Paracidovorax cattleyae]